MEEMAGVEDTIDLTNETFMDVDVLDGGEMMSDEDYAKHLQMQEYETLRIADYNIAQQLQDELKRESEQRLREYIQRESERDHGIDHQPFVLHHDSFLVRHPHRSQRTRSLRSAQVTASSEEPEDGANNRISAFRVFEALRRNREMPAEAEGSQPPGSAAAAADAGSLDEAVPPPVPPRPPRSTRRRAIHHMQGDGHQRYRVVNDRRFHIPHHLYHARGLAPRLLDFDDESGNNYDALWDLSERIGEVGRKGLSKTEINRLPTIKYRAQESTMASAESAITSKASDLGGRTSGYSASIATSSSSAEGMQNDTTLTEERDCRICLCGFENEEVLRALPCCHRFHINCIDQWIKKNAICPVCRDDVKDHVRMTDNVHMTDHIRMTDRVRMTEHDWAHDSLI